MSTPLLVAPSTNTLRCFAISSGFFLPMALRNRSRSAQRVSGEYLSDLHHLFLIQDDPVRRLENGFQRRMQILDFGLPMLASDEIVNHPGLERDPA